MYLLGKFCKFLVELVDTASRIHKFHFAREERMAEGRDFHFDQWILFAVFPGGFFTGVGAGTAQKCFIGGNIFEYHEAVVGRMDFFFHNIKQKKLLTKSF